MSVTASLFLSFCVCMYVSICFCVSVCVYLVCLSVSAFLSILYTCHRYGGNQVVVHLMEGGRVRRGGKELQLASMQQLTTHSSNQHFLLRLLKVIVSLRDWIKKTKKAGACNVVW